MIAKNIGDSVSAVDVRTLFSTAGTITRIAAVLGATGAATYEIDFAHSADARRCVYEYDQRTLDGRKMALTLAKDSLAKPEKAKSNGGAALFAAAMNAAATTSNRPTKNTTQPKKHVAIDLNNVTKVPKNIVVDVSTALKSTRGKQKIKTPLRIPPKTSAHQKKSRRS